MENNFENHHLNKQHCIDKYVLRCYRLQLRKKNSWKSSEDLQ